MTKTRTSWHQLYRPDSIENLHSKTVREQLQKLLKSGRFPQVLLLAGPRGMGKTSTARIIAALFNDPANEKAVKQRLGLSTSEKDANEDKLLPFLDPNPTNETVARIRSGSSLAVIELDAASHRGIDDVRALKEQLYLPPQDGLVKVVILDEVHMLTTEAFNALLKILEEPPAHVVFVLATTELHKIPATVASRATLIQFKQATGEEISEAVERVLKKENITYDKEGISALAVAAQGSFRDAIKLAELVTALQGEVTGEAVLAAVPKPLEKELVQLHEAILQKKEKELTQLFAGWRSRRIETTLFATVWLNYLHAQLLINVETGDTAARINRFLLQEFALVSPVESSVIPLLGYELKALDLIYRSQDKSKTGGSSTSSGTGHSESTLKKSTVQKNKPPIVELPPAPDADTDLEVEQPETPEMVKADNFVIPSAIDSTILLEKWQEFMQGVKQRNATVAAILDSSRPQRGEKGQALIDVFYQFHKDQLQQPKFRKLLEESVIDVLGSSVTFEFRLAQSPLKEEKKEGEDLPSLAAEILV